MVFLTEAPTLSRLAQLFRELTTDHEKLGILDALPNVQHYFSSPSPVRTFLSGLSPECELAIKSIVAIDQAHIFTFHSEAESLRSLLEDLLAVERFYKEFGGIVGYHALMQELLQPTEAKELKRTAFLSPEGVNIAYDTPDVREAVLQGILRLPEMGEIYPLGGAGDRLSLLEADTGRPLPAATLPFCGKSLVQGLLEDLQAREHLYYQLTGERLITPVAIMTSRDLENHPRIIRMFEDNDWFGRPKDSFKIFRQPLVPVLDESGKWCLKADGHLLMKPGGHGVIWKLAKDAGIFDWFYAKGRKKALMRQINNPIAGLDHGLLAFTGLGLNGDKAFGFASCDRVVGAKEGMNVLIEEKGEAVRYTLTNIEYTDFQKHGLEDRPVSQGSPFSRFPSNTNILFVDLKRVESLTEQHPIPGMLVNRKPMNYLDPLGNPKHGKVVRLESTMQNLADYVQDVRKSPLQKGEWRDLSTFVTFNQRLKTISCTKKKYLGDDSFLETPEGAFADLQKNGRDLLVQQCGWKVPKASAASEMLVSRPAFLFLYHPTLGPLYSVISQKLKSGSLKEGSELQIEMSEVELEEVSIDGSVHLIAKEMEQASCVLKRVTFSNRGINPNGDNVYWKNQIERSECFSLTIFGNGEFVAEDVHFRGAHNITIPSGTRITARQKGQGIELISEPITTPIKRWRYSVDASSRIALRKD